jgi:ribosome-binding factor A
MEDKIRNMESTRQQKVSRQIQKDLGEIFQRMGNSFSQGKMVTVTSVRVSPDLSFAKIYLSIFPSQNNKEFLEHVQTLTKPIRNELGKRLKNQVRIIPELAFFIDDSLDYVQRIDDLLSK